MKRGSAAFGAKDCDVAPSSRAHKVCNQKVFVTFLTEPLWAFATRKLLTKKKAHLEAILVVLVGGGGCSCGCGGVGLFGVFIVLRLLSRKNTHH